MYILKNYRNIILWDILVVLRRLPSESIDSIQRCVPWEERRKGGRKGGREERFQNTVPPN